MTFIESHTSILFIPSYGEGGKENGVWVDKVNRYYIGRLDDLSNKVKLISETRLFSDHEVIRAADVSSSEYEKKLF